MTWSRITFNFGLSKVSLNNKWGYINKFGKEIIPFKYEKAYSFKNGYADVFLNNELFIIDKIGKVFFKSTNIKYLLNVYNDLFIVKHNNDSVYILDKNGQNQSNGANKIVSFDGENFILLIGKSAYNFNKKTLTHITLENVVNVYAYKMGVYHIECKGEKDEKANSTVFDKYGNYLAYTDKFYKFLEHDDLALLESFWEVKKTNLYKNMENDNSHYIYSYFTSTGKAFSDIMK